MSIIYSLSTLMMWWCSINICASIIDQMRFLLIKPLKVFLNSILFKLFLCAKYFQFQFEYQLRIMQIKCLKSLFTTPLGFEQQKNVRMWEMYYRVGNFLWIIWKLCFWKLLPTAYYYNGFNLMESKKLAMWWRVELYHRVEQKKLF
jgi:hypothetical protein